MKVENNKEQVEALVAANVNLARYVARKSNNFKELDLADLESATFFGLYKAAKAYDVATGARFSTFAVTCMQNEIRGLLRKKRLNVISYDGQLTEDEYTLLDFLVAPEDIETNVLTNSRYETVLKVIDALPEKQRNVIRYRYIDGYTQREVASLVNVSQAQVSRLEKKALHTLELTLRPVYEGYDLITVRKDSEQPTPNTQADNSAIVDHKGNTFCSVSEMCAYYGVHPKKFSQRRTHRWTLQESLEGKFVKDHLGNTFSTKLAMCKHHNVALTLFSYRINKGWSLDEALEGRTAELMV